MSQRWPRARWVWGWAGIAVLMIGGGCPIGPPIVGPPDELDFAPLIDPEDIRPPNEDFVCIDRSRSEAPRNFQVLRVRDPNFEDDLRFEIDVIVPQDRPGTEPAPVSEGPLQIAGVQEGDDFTTYEGVLYRLDPLAEEFIEDHAVLRLRIIDEIPLSQQELLGRSEHIVEIWWDIEFIPDCRTPF